MIADDCCTQIDNGESFDVLRVYLRDLDSDFGLDFTFEYHSGMIVDFGIEFTYAWNHVSLNLRNSSYTISDLSTIGTKLQKITKNLKAYRETC